MGACFSEPQTQQQSPYAVQGYNQPPPGYNSNPPAGYNNNNSNNGYPQASAYPPPPHSSYPPPAPQNYQHHIAAAQSYAAAAASAVAAVVNNATGQPVSQQAGAPGNNYAPHQFLHAAPSSAMTASMIKVLFFPDPALPCRNARRPGGCRRPNCTFAHEDTSLSQLLAVLSMAVSTLDICVFSITCDEIADTVLELHQRGVKVRIITDDDQAKTVGSDAARLQQAGIQVKSDHSDKHMHHKMAIIDGRILVNGSFNWTRQAVIGNNENIVIQDTPAVVAEFKAYFERLWSRFTPL